MSALGEIDPQTTSGTDLATRLTVWGGTVDAALGGGSAVPNGRRIITEGTFLGGGNLSTDLHLRLANDVPIGSLPAGYYYGTAVGVADSGTGRAFHSLATALAQLGASSNTGNTGGNNTTVVVNQSPVKRVLDCFGAGPHDMTIPANVNGLFFWMYAGGSSNGAGRGGCASGKIDVSPGSSIHFEVGGVGGSTSIGGAVICTPGVDDTDGTAYIPNGFNFFPAAPVLQGFYAGYPGVTGFLWVEFIAT